MSRVAVVTGAGSGVGRAVVNRMAREGWSVGLIGRSRESLDDTIRIAGVGSVINAGSGTNNIEDSGSGNRIIMPAIGGFDDVFGYVLQNSDMLDFRAALSKTTWNGSNATLGNFLKVTMSGTDATIALAPTAGGAATKVAVLRDSGSLDLAGLLTHAIV